MDKSYLVLGQLSEVLNLDYFYVITINRNEVNLQGIFSNGVMRAISKYLEDKRATEHEQYVADGGWFHFNFTFEGVRVKIALSE